MTAVLNWDLLRPSDSDADLARASAAGDKKAFAVIYDRYADRLHDFCAGMLADRDSAADCVQDAFCTAATQLPQLRDPNKLRPWLYSIARNEALHRLRDRRRETPSDDLPDAASGDPGPDTLAARLELAELIADAAGGLSDRDRAVLELAFRHGLNGPDLADALGVTPTNANTIVHRLRETIERSLGALLVSRRIRNKDGCPELSTILDGWDGHFNVLMRKRISRHIESCDTCDEERRQLVSPAALLGAAPVFVPAPAWLRERTLREVQLTSAARPISDGPRQPDGAQSGRSTRSPLLPVIAFVAALIAALGATLAWVNLQKTTIEAPREVGEMTPVQPVWPPSVAPASPPPTAHLEPPEPATSEPPAQRSAAAPRPAPTPVVSPVSEPPPPPPPPALPPAPPPLPPLPPLLPLPPWPQFPPWPGGDPGGDPGGPGPNPGSQFNGPSDIGINPPDPAVP